MRQNLTNWLNINLELFIKEKTDIVTKGVFELQFQLYHKHLIELLQEFNETHQIELKEEFTVEELLSEYIPEMISRYGLTSENVDLEKEESNQTEEAKTNEKNVEAASTSKKTDPKTDNTTKTIKKKSKPDIDEQDIEDFLFKTVFGVQSIN